MKRISVLVTAILSFAALSAPELEAQGCDSRSCGVTHETSHQVTASTEDNDKGSTHGPDQPANCGGIGGGAHDHECANEQEDVDALTLALASALHEQGKLVAVVASMALDKPWGVTVSASRSSLIVGPCLLMESKHFALSPIQLMDAMEGLAVAHDLRLARVADRPQTP